jgi:hypothetical protein
MVASTDWRPYLLTVENDEGTADNVVVMRPLDAKRVLVRSPDYGGPVIEGSLSPALVREACDDALRAAGAVSDVTVFSPTLAEQHGVIDAWGAWPQKAVCFTDLSALSASPHPALQSSNRRRDLKRAAAEASVTCSALDHAGASRFAEQYAAHMAAIGADERWILAPAVFTALADTGVDAWIATAASATGGAALIYVTSGSAATYLYGTRWGTPRGESTLAHVRMHEHLAASGCTEALLGGGVGEGDDDSLLAFKRSLASRESTLYLAARSFDPAGHERAVRAGVARPLPVAAVQR